ncbi:Crp/Fnr family transcriptional regulator [Flavitalea sp. BT771]|uniref:Crp/Fnr family transcriptional regulator n=1 Tax=Flavitalea sp. BT771 TaxID=3063329 RepID=UPI0026E29141|nr:Crp/Fnr family transcriptional regulator [Flavitalea sp. BT771]MDO6430355.1 Crp/Fnr family transcriptional regulator [Flavitalea sp. BT771]MDV6219505.1 Crp/Fnr family transcriptional regulator [Flavitalea sp. BT771]
MVEIEKIKALFPSFDRDLVRSMSEHADLREFKAGEPLMKTGQNIRSTMLITKGLVKIFREDDEGNEFFMYYLQPGQACALSMICATKQETSQIMARAVTDTESIMVPLEYMDKWMTQYKSWYHFVLESYRARFEELLLTVDHIAFRNMDERLLFYLKKQQETLKSNRLYLSNTEIASDLNSSREVVSRLMKKLADRQLIRLDRNYIEILHLDV